MMKKLLVLIVAATLVACTERVDEAVPDVAEDSFVVPMASIGVTVTEIETDLGTGDTPAVWTALRSCWRSIAIYGVAWGGATAEVNHRISASYAWRQMLNTSSYTVGDAVAGVVFTEPAWVGAGSQMKLVLSGGTADSFKFGATPCP